MDNTQPIPVDEAGLKREIYKTLGVEKMPPEAQEAVLAAAAGPIMQSVTLAILMALPPQGQEQFKNAMDKGDGELVRAIIIANIPDSTAFIGEEVKKATAEFRRLFEKELAG